MNFVKSAKHILPAGEYFIGDVCYFLQDTIYEKIWDKVYSCNEGCFVKKDGAGFGTCNVESGNGVYHGSNKFRYEVDNFNIGIVSAKFGDKKKFTGCGTFHLFELPVTFTKKDGVIVFESGDWSLKIDTNDNEEISSDDTGYDSWS